jgi:hypothetical protein
VAAASLLASFVFGIVPLIPHQNMSKAPVVHVESTGPDSPNVVGNTGTVTITSGQQSVDENRSKKSPKDKTGGAKQ